MMEEQLLSGPKQVKVPWRISVSCHVGKKNLPSRIFSFTTVIRLQTVEQQLQKARAEKEELRLLFEEREENVC